MMMMMVMLYDDEIGIHGLSNVLHQWPIPILNKTIFQQIRSCQSILWPGALTLCKSSSCPAKMGHLNLPFSLRMKLWIMIAKPSLSGSPCSTSWGTGPTGLVGSYEEPAGGCKHAQSSLTHSWWHSETMCTKNTRPQREMTVSQVSKEPQFHMYYIPAVASNKAD